MERRRNEIIYVYMYIHLQSYTLSTLPICICMLLSPTDPCVLTRLLKSELYTRACRENTSLGTGSDEVVVVVDASAEM